MAKIPERGFAAIGAIFLVVVLGGIATAITTVAMGQQKKHAMDWLSTQAYYAARTGLEYAMYRAINEESCAVGSDPPITPAAWGGRFTVAINCVIRPATDGEALRVYRITATACNQATCPGDGSATYVERQVRTIIEGPAP